MQVTLPAFSITSALPSLMNGGNLDAADAWYREKAPREPTHLNVMRRYQYLTQAMVELENGRSDAGGVLPAFPRTPPCPR